MKSSKSSEQDSENSDSDSEHGQTAQKDTAQEEEECAIPQQEIKLDIDESNIISESRKRKATEDFSEKTYKRNRAAFSLSLLQQREIWA
jgi:hypothetical protein